jgi:peptide/nickel transport system permease protein
MSRENHQESNVKKTLQRMINPLTILGFTIILFILSIAIFAPWISMYSYKDAANGLFLDPYAPPSPDHPFGTAELGRDVLARLIWGTRASLLLGVFTIIISITIGIILGLLSAYLGGWVDNLIMRAGEISFTFPNIVITIVVVALVGNDNPYRLQIILFVWGIIGSSGYARLLRSSALQEKGKMYVLAAKVTGASKLRVMFRHILPNSLTPIIIAASFNIGGVILGLAGLSFIGFGATNMIEWGADVAMNRSYLIAAPWTVLVPGIAILLTVLGFMLIGDGLRDALDPRTVIKKKIRT